MKGIQGTSNKTYRQLMGNGLRYEDKLAARQRELAKHAKAVWKIQELSY